MLSTGTSYTAHCCIKLYFTIDVMLPFVAVSGLKLRICIAPHHVPAAAVAEARAPATVVILVN